MNTVIRYIITHRCNNGFGGRQLAETMQGRYTYATLQEAQEHIDNMMANNSMDILNSLFNLPLKAMPCECYAGHFDPVGRYFPE